MALRRRLDSLGFGIAEAMDTAQRFYLGWTAARELIERTGAMQLPHGFVAGAGTDHLGHISGPTDLVDGTVEQCRVIQQHGGIPTILPMPWLSLNQATEQTYVDVYSAITAQLDGPLFVHWLGEMFLPSLRGYFPGDSFSRIMASAPGKLRGCKISLLDAELEVRIRHELLPRKQIVLTGDDFHFSRMILGGPASGPDPQPPPEVTEYQDIGPHRVALGDFSHALLGVFDAIAEPAGLALRALAQNDGTRFQQIMGPCETLGQHLFAAPTQHYKAGLAFLSWLSGLQDNAMLVNREDRARDDAHRLRCIELARACGVLASNAAVEARISTYQRTGKCR